MNTFQIILNNHKVGLTVPLIKKHFLSLNWRKVTVFECIENVYQNISGLGKQSPCDVTEGSPKLLIPANLRHFLFVPFFLHLQS